MPTKSVDTPCGNDSKNKERTLMLLSASFMGLVGLFVNNLPNSFVSSCVRGLFGAIFIFIYFLFRGKLSEFERLKPTWKWQLFAGAISALNVGFYFFGIVTVGPAIAAFLLYTGGVFALIFSRIIFKEKIAPKKWLAFLLAVIGVAVILEPWNSGNMEENPDYLGGILISILSGMLLGIYITLRKVIYRKMDKIDPTYKDGADFYIAMVIFPTSILALIFLPVSGSTIINFTPFQWIMAISLGLIPTAVAFSFYNIALQKDKHGDIIIISYIEPIIASIINLIINGGIPITVILGGGVILVANLIILFSNQNKKSA